jgi:hypothetical protein
MYRPGKWWYMRLHCKPQTGKCFFLFQHQAKSGKFSFFYSTSEHRPCKRHLVYLVHVCTAFRWRLYYTKESNKFFLRHLFVNVRMFLLIIYRFPCFIAIQGNTLGATSKSFNFSALDTLTAFHSRHIWVKAAFAFWIHIYLRVCLCRHHTAQVWKFLLSRYSHSFRFFSLLLLLFLTDVISFQYKRNSVIFPSLTKPLS